MEYDSDLGRNVVVSWDEDTMKAMEFTISGAALNPDPANPIVNVRSAETRSAGK